MPLLLLFYFFQRRVLLYNTKAPEQPHESGGPHAACPTRHRRHVRPAHRTLPQLPHAYLDAYDVNAILASQ